MVTLKNLFQVTTSFLYINIQKDRFFWLYGWMLGVVVLMTGVFLVSAPVFVVNILSIGVVLLGIFFLGLNLKHRPITSVLIVVSAAIVYWGFSYYFKMDRDYAAYMINAVYLIRNGTFWGEAFYFHRGMDIVNGVLTTSFLFGYSVFLAPFVVVFGQVGYYFANLSLLAISMLSLQKVLSYLKPLKGAYWDLGLIFLFSPIVIWLFSYTYSETLFLPVTWGAIAIFLESKKRMSWIGLLISYIAVTVSLTIRMEAVGLMAMIGIGTNILYFRWKIGWKRYLIATMIAVLVTLGVSLLVFNISGHYVQNQIGGVAPVADVSHTENTTSDFIERQQLLFFSFGTYLVLIPLAWGLSRKEMFTNKQFWWVLGISLPFVLYLYNPRITRDMLWYLRRFIPMVIPLIFVIGAYGISLWYRRYPKIVVGMVTMYMFVQGIIVNHIVLNSHDQRGFYDRLDTFMTKTIDDTEQGTIQVITDMSQKNEANRIMPYWVYENTQFEYQTIAWEDERRDGPGEEYLVSSTETSRKDLKLLGVFEDEIFTRNPHWNPRLPILSPSKTPIQLYVYTYQ